ncbi:OmpW/AlkL family protein [Thalassotalea agarivorans]|uniref:Outer membrane protein n=1 Tax=Thalassotalea agarivorans TaxID=349064 RepID=A0A1I0GG80_THASX|nr:OmpW family outer membrane protein [Thalassotalea agarivorans]SET69314.1 outer membrane protein [Thalassotalea agarivorans]
MKSLFTVTLASIVLLSSFASDATRFRGGNQVVKIGAIASVPTETESVLYIGSSETLNNVELEQGISGFASWQYFFNYQWAIETTVGGPIKHDVNLFGTANEAAFANFSYMPVYVDLVYYMDTRSRFKPYIGGGMNYSFVTGEDLNTFNTALYSNFEADMGFGYNAQLGMDVFITRNLMLNASVKYMYTKLDVGFDVTLTGRAVGDFDMHPVVGQLSLGYRF